MSITVTNGASAVVKVAISTWQKDGNDDFWSLDQGASDTWKRSDPRGYLMAVQDKSRTTEYYVSCNSAIVIEDNLVKDHGRTLNPLIAAGQKNVANA
ncbi:hypothetical protein [Pseudomonas chlororaphis]|nr:hypothetical protein [Pseudomonas chlororaphis]AZD02821.1 hypothetical protein C4K27_3628 [Pseudomonas chlororaphis subsp. chlororaphis]MBM0280847.1 hypothetical protein [Pseudomonas chlororaphis]MDO1504512.1 hypothetical protein [Pseudomonas chlororaphis]ORM44728.1 hypothetical protein B6D51_30580 [Pseudomonas chlororaphis subsp. chlororaphis]TWR95652.1 hypothetical protein FJD36_11805 [Pseudomonas chlororaphis subsp. chlororaphis]